MAEFNYSERWPMHPQFQHIRVLNSLVGKCLEDGVGVGIQFCMCVRAPVWSVWTDGEN